MTLRRARSWSSTPPRTPAAAAVPVVGALAPAPREGGGYVLDNGLLRVEVDARGLVVSAYDVGAERESVAPGGAANLLQIHPDFPNMWDAWDVDEFYRNTVTDLTDLDELVPVEDGWHETEKFLKAAFPLDVHAERYASETQFGHFYRATRTNTSWEAAKFEACNHRFVHLEEPGWGVALVHDSTYGHDVTRTVRDSDAGTTTTVRISLLRAPPLPRPGDRPGCAPFPARARPRSGDR